jgi:hypothetical protein
MINSYVEAISLGFPAVQVHCIGDDTVYSNLVWDGGAPLPSKQTLDEWMLANPSVNQTQLTKYEFRKLFTFQERVIIDNAPNNTSLPEQYRAAITTMLKDLQLVDFVDLQNADVINGVNMLEQMGLLGTGRAAQILAGTAPQ